MRRVSVLAGVVLLLGLLASREAAACSCMASGPACQAFWKTEAVFDATVDRIETAMGPEQDLGNRRQSFPENLVRMTVRQALKGVTATGPLDVYTADTEGACGYDFKVGHRYLVFASKRRADGRWVASYCSATQPYDGTGETAAFVASLAEPGKGGRVFGSIRSYERLFDLGRIASARSRRVCAFPVAGRSVRSGRPAAGSSSRGSTPARTSSSSTCLRVFPATAPGAAPLTFRTRTGAPIRTFRWHRPVESSGAQWHLTAAPLAYFGLKPRRLRRARTRCTVCPR